MGEPQHQLWNRALAMYGKRHPKVMPACHLSYDWMVIPTCARACQDSGYLALRKHARRGTIGTTLHDDFPALLEYLETPSFSVTPAQEVLLHVLT